MDGAAPPTSKAGGDRSTAPVSGVAHRFVVPPVIAYALVIFFDKLFSFITIPLMAYYVSPADYGRYDVALSMLEIVTIIAALGLTDTLVRFSTTAATPEARTSAAAELLGVAIILAVTLLITLQLLAPALMRGWQITLDATAVRASLATNAINCLSDMAMVWLRIRDRVRLFVTIAICRILAFVSATIFSLVGGYGVDGILLGSSLIGIVSMPIILSFMVRETGVKFSPAAVRNVLVYGLPLVASGVCGYALSGLSRLFLIENAPIDAIGLLSLATRLASVVTLLFVPYVLWWGPIRFAVLQEPGGLGRTSAQWGAGFALLICAMAFTILAAPVVVYLALPAAYVGSLIYLPGMVLAAALVQLSWLTNVGTYARSNGVAVFTIEVLSAVLATLGYWLLVPRYGIAGAIVALNLALFARWGLHLIVGHTKAPIQYPVVSALLLALAAFCAIQFAPAETQLVARSAWTLLAMAGMISVAITTGLAGPIVSGLRQAYLGSSLGR
jgi:O-antigen/teichoic acid export membrane protein